MLALRITVYVLLCIVLAGAGLLIPAYFQAIDPAVASLAAQRAESLEEQAATLRLAGSPVAAEFLRQETGPTDTTTEEAHPLWTKVRNLSGQPADGAAVGSLLTRTHRTETILLLEEDGRSGVRTVLQYLPREPQVGSTAEWISRNLPARIGGILVAALAAERSLQPAFLGRLSSLGETSEDDLRSAFSDVATWGTTLPFDALGHFISSFDDPVLLGELTRSPSARDAEGRVLLARLVLVGASPEALLRFLKDQPTSGFDDLRNTFAEGPGGALLLIAENKPLRKDIVLPASVLLPDWPFPVALVLDHPVEALFTRIALFIGAAFFLLLGLHQVLPNLGDRHLAGPTAIQSFFRRMILGSILAGALLFLLEPSLLRQPESAPPAPQAEARLSLASLTNPPVTDMNSIEIDQVTLLILTIFFVLQVGLYVFCLVKLSEIRRQRVSDATKLHLLDNEENLFDSGLYLGLGGTVASLIFLALGVVEASLMAAYASTLFGILSVSLFKIFHLRPLRRKLILSARAET